MVRRRWPRALAILALLLGLVGSGLWLARKPIARGQVDRFLGQAQVPARYTISDLGLGRQRLSDVVLGDPAHPDLVADWLETRTAWGLRGPYLASVRGGHVRVRARWADGRLTLGSIDRLLPKGDVGKPFALPALGLDVQDLRALVETPWGVVGAALTGKGRIDGGFEGRLAATSARVDAGCRAVRPEGAWRLRTMAAGVGRPARVELEGSAQVAGIACARATAGYANANGTATVMLGDRLGWSIAQDVAATDVAGGMISARSVTGRVSLAGGSTRRGPVSLRAAEVAAPGLRVARLTLDGTVFQEANRQGALTYDGRLSFAGGRWDAAAVRGLAPAGRETPVAPLLRQFGQALIAVAADMHGDARIAATADRDGVAVHLTGATVASGSGASLVYSGGPGFTYAAHGWQLGGSAQLRGGSLPAGTALFDGRPGVVSGTAVMAPYAAGTARLALTPIAFVNARGSWRVTTRATLSGPLADGRVEGLDMPIDATWRGGALTLSDGCAPMRWTSITVAGLHVDPGALALCPQNGALVSYAGGRLSGGARIAAARLTGRLGATPLTLAATDARLRLADHGFALRQVEARLGTPARVTRLSVGSLDGRMEAGGLAGRFAEASGQIGAVPLALSKAVGTWRFADGMLTVGGAMTVADTAAPARFQPMAAHDVTLRLVTGRIIAGGLLTEPITATKVADVAIRHDLSSGQGTADLTVPSLSFVKGFQPDQLTRLTFGVIAEVRGTVSGTGHIAWTPAGVASTGAFNTAGTDLAAAFGPVQGVAGEVRFSDLLQLQSAPGQRFTVKSINPGVPVTDGVITFQTLPGARVQVEGAHWPFAGGTLTLDPTLLDFSAAAQRRMTFRVAGAAADQFLQSFDFKNLDATGTFDGVLPMIFDAGGGRIENGRLAVRPGGGTLAYVGDISRKNLGFWGNFAFDALKSLRYRSLGIVMNGPLAGEMVTEVRFAGVGQGVGAKSNFVLRRLQRLPLVFNIRIQAPFRGLLDTTTSFYDPRRLIERNLPTLIERQNKPIQPPASETMR